MDDQIVQSGSYSDITDNPRVLAYIDLAFQMAPLVNKALDVAFQAVPLVDKALDLGSQLSKERETRLKIQVEAEERRMLIERKMDQLDAELAADFEERKNVFAASMRAFEKLIESGHVEQAMILHERVINKLSGRVSVAADKFNQNNPDGQVKFYTT
jgi:hypothetical protein